MYTKCFQCKLGIEFENIYHKVLLKHNAWDYHPTHQKSYHPQKHPNVGITFEIIQLFHSN